jgi:hypothetical protein
VPIEINWQTYYRISEICLKTNHLTRLDKMH